MRKLYSIAQFRCGMGLGCQNRPHGSLPLFLCVLIRSMQSYPKKTSSATEGGRETDFGRGPEASTAIGEKRRARIQPSPTPAHRKVTAVGRSYSVRFLVLVSMSSLFELTCGGKKATHRGRNLGGHSGSMLSICIVLLFISSFPMTLTCLPT